MDPQRAARFFANFGCRSGKSTDARNNRCLPKPLAYTVAGRPLLAAMLVFTIRQSKIAHFSSAGRPLLHHVGEAAWRGGDMYDMETKMLPKHYLEQGVSKAELARRLAPEV